MGIEMGPDKGYGSSPVIPETPETPVKSTPPAEEKPAEDEKETTENA